MEREKAPPKAGPYVLFGLGYAAVVSIGRFASPYTYPPQTLIGTIPSLVMGMLAGLVVWSVVRFISKRRRLARQREQNQDSA